MFRLFVPDATLANSPEFIKQLIPGYSGKARIVQAMSKHIPSAGSFIVAVPFGAGDSMTIIREYTGCMCQGDGIHVSMTHYDHFTQIPYAGAFADGSIINVNV